MKDEKELCEIIKEMREDCGSRLTKYIPKLYKSRTCTFLYGCGFFVMLSAEKEAIF